MSAELIASIRDEIERLWHTPHPSSAGLRQTSRGLLLAALDASSPIETLSVDPRERPGDLSDSVLHRTLLTARTVAWFSVNFVTFQSRAEDLVLAALLTDVGRLRPQRRSVQSEPPSTRDAEHVQIGAAFAAGLVDVPVSLSLRVARHHERSDGTGFPLRLTAARTTVDDRAISAAVRYAELFEGGPLAAAKRLHHEARLGGFDAELTANLLWSMGGEFPFDATMTQGVAKPWSLTDHGRRRLRFDHAQLAARPPHFLNAPVRPQLSDRQGARSARTSY